MGIKNYIGLKFPIGDECEAVITREDLDALYIKSDFFTGWMMKTEFWERWGVADEE